MVSFCDKKTQFNFPRVRKIDLGCRKSAILEIFHALANLHDTVCKLEQEAVFNVR